VNKRGALTSDSPSFGLVILSKYRFKNS